MEFIVFGIIFIVIAVVALFIIFKPVIENKKIQNGVINSDTFTQNYSFELNCTQQEAIQQLSTHNVNDTLDYSFDSDSLSITFTRFSATIEHRLAFYIVGNTTYLKVSRVNLLHGKSNIPLMINRFFVEKISAKPIDYSVFECQITSSKKENQK